MAIEAAPKLAASIGLHVFDGLLSKACPNRRGEERRLNGA
jgi:hypothetical protein